MPVLRGSRRQLSLRSRWQPEHQYSLLFSDGFERSRAVASLEGRSFWSAQERNDIGIVVREGVDVIDSMVPGIVHIGVRLVTGHETPTAIDVIVGRLAIHEGHTSTFDGDHVRREARPVALCQRPDRLRGELKSL